MSSRLDRYEHFLNAGYSQGFLRYDEYSLAEITPSLRQRIANREFQRIIFSGMGCSAIVSDVIRTYFNQVKPGVEIVVFNDYDYDNLVPDSMLNDKASLFIISSYSGHSEEPIRVLNNLRHCHDRTLVLTSGGRLANLARDYGVSIARWQLSQPDREYPLFHVGQYFAILLDMFFQLGLTEDHYHTELIALAAQLDSDYTVTHKRMAREVALRSQDANIIMAASPKWHDGLLKLAKMHLNEIAMVPASRNYFHEFCHSEVATLSDPARKYSLLLFVDTDDDDYTRAKMRNLADLLTSDAPENRNVMLTEISLDQPTFMRKYFGALKMVQEITLHLGRKLNTKSRDLISEAAGNPWYHSRTICSEVDTTPEQHISNA